VVEVRDIVHDVAGEHMPELLDVVSPPTDQRVNVRVRDEAVRRSVHLDAQRTIDEHSVTKERIQGLPARAANDRRQVRLP